MKRWTRPGLSLLDIKVAILIMFYVLGIPFGMVACAEKKEIQVAGITRPEVPPEFAAKTNPFSGDAAAISAGEELFRSYCAACHGVSGGGDGPSASALNPKPPSLAIEESRLSDAYLFWRIYAGGGMAPFNSAMPAWKGIFSEEKIWQVISYLRTFGK